MEEEEEEEKEKASLVLVTGASGYLATHVVKQLQEAGYRVRGTVRSTQDEKKVKHLYDLCPLAKHKLELVEADLLQAAGWDRAVSGCAYVHHVASPFPLANPKHEDLVIRPAVDGTLHVLQAVRDAGTVKRVVLTSSFIAIADKGDNSKPYTEEDWVDPDSKGISAYSKSKILAERAAWDFVDKLPEGKKFELAVVNPTLIAGPTLHGSAGSSMEVLLRLMTKKNRPPRVPRLNFPVCDVRDVARAHVRCQQVEGAAGHRHIVWSANIWFRDLAKLLDEEFRPQGYNIPTGGLPDCLLSCYACVNKEVREARKISAKEMKLEARRMREVLGISSPIPAHVSYIDMAYSMVDRGFIPKANNYRGRPQDRPSD